MKINITDHTIENTLEKKLIKDLTISEFKELMKDIISEEIKYIPQQFQPCQPHYHEFTYPWDDRNKVWCDISNVQNIHKEEI